MNKKKKIIIARYLIVLAFILSIKIALMLWNEIGYNSLLMIYGLPLGLYFPVTLTILFFMTFKPHTQNSGGTSYNSCKGE